MLRTSFIWLWIGAARGILNGQ